LSPSSPEHTIPNSLVGSPGTRRSSSGSAPRRCAAAPARGQRDEPEREEGEVLLDGRHGRQSTVGPRAYTPCMPTTAIVWFRRDLRVHDHPALHTAVAEYDRVVRSSSSTTRSCTAATAAARGPASCSVRWRRSTASCGDAAAASSSATGAPSTSCSALEPDAVLWTSGRLAVRARPRRPGDEALRAAGVEPAPAHRHVRRRRVGAQAAAGVQPLLPRVARRSSAGRLPRADGPGRRAVDRRAGADLGVGRASPSPCEPGSRRRARSTCGSTARSTTTASARTAWRGRQSVSRLPALGLRVGARCASSAR
jgi:hypothetical protein